MLSHLKSLILLAALCLLTVACSQISMAYRNLDWLIPWRVNQYLALDSEQKAWLKPRIQQHLNWHCSSELPHYIDWLQRTQALAQSTPSSEQLDAQMLEAEQAFHAIVSQTNPTAVALLGTLSDEQVGKLYARMEEDRREDHEEFLGPPLATQISERAERLEKRLRPWFGQLSTEQKARIGQWASERREQNRLWLENRGRWQHEFRTALDARQGSDFNERMTQVLENRRGAHDEQAAKAYRESRMAMAALFSDLLQSTDAAQRTQLNKRFAALHKDLSDSVCSS